MFLDNAVLRREMLTSLRTKRSFVLQAVFLGVLGGLMLIGWPGEDVVSTTSQKEISRNIFKYFMRGAVAMIAMLAPAFSAGSITIEKERRSMDLLQTTPLTPAAIVAGKFGASLGYLILLIFSTMPLLSLCVMMPGVQPEEIMSLYAILLATSATFGMIGLTASAFFDRTHAALAITYLLVFPGALILLLLSFTDAFFTYGSAMSVGILATVACLLMYTVISARMKKPFEPEVIKDEEDEIANQTGLVLVSEQFPDRLLHPTKRDDFLPDGGNPVVQKELRTELFGKGALFLRLLIQISSVLTIAFIWTLFIQKQELFVYYLIVFSMLVGPAFASGAFTQERERGTRDMLLGTLVKPHQVVFGKFYAAARSSLILTGLLSLPLGLGLIFAQDFGLRLVQLILEITVITVGIFGSVAMAMTYSMFLRTTLQSMVMSYSTMLVLYIGPVVMGPAIKTLSRTDAEWVGLLSVTSPFAAAQSIGMMGSGQGGPDFTWLAFLVLYGALTFLMLMAMLRRWTMIARGRYLD